MSSNNRRLGYSKSFSVFSRVSFAGMMVLLLFIGFNFSFTLVAFKAKAKKTEIIRPTTTIQKAFHWGSHFSVIEEIEVEAYNNIEEPDTLVCPPNLKPQERIDWFKEKIPEFGIFKSSALSRQFEGRARKFLGGGGCEGQFYMTWIAPVKSFRRRELLSIESLFKAHPNGCLMILSRSMDSIEGNQVLKPLTESGFRVTAITPDFNFLLKNTTAEAWLDDIKYGNRDPGEIPLAQNLSNLLRLAVLYKFGGIYLDTDFIVLKKLSNLRNAIGAQSMDLKSGNWTRLNNAILIFDKEHPILLKFLEEFSLTFDGNKWGHNGPYLLSRVVESIGKSPDYNVRILPPVAFYPVDWNKIVEFFQKPEGGTRGSKLVELKVQQLKRWSSGLHLWNKHSSKLKVEEGSIIDKLVSDHCVLCQNTNNI